MVDQTGKDWMVRKCGIDGKDWMVGKCGLDREGLDGKEVWIR